MTQVFAGDDQVADPGIITRAGRIPTQSHGGESAPPTLGPPTLGPAMTPGKGVRRIRCVGCAHDTLPRNDDGAPLCPRCSELLAAAVDGDGDGAIGALIGPVTFRAPRWMRRRSTLG